MWSVPIQMPRLPLTLTCYADAHVSFAPYTRFDVVIDQVDSELQVVVNENEIKLGNDEVVEYNSRYAYKQKPMLLKWLQSLSMDMPHFIQGTQ